MTRPPLLLLLDIDGTLLAGATDAHARALYRALGEVHGLSVVEGLGVETAGRTDGDIARTILLGHGVSATRIDERAGDVREACCRAYVELCPDDLSGCVLPGVVELLETLGGREDVLLALLTGNFEPVARRKLRQAGLGHHFAHGQGAFGSDSDDRSDLPAIARERAGHHPRERTLVIGDTPRDIACARADGVGCLAVATGRFGAAELAGADGVARDARELPGLLAGWLGG